MPQDNKPELSSKKRDSQKTPQPDTALRQKHGRVVKSEESQKLVNAITIVGEDGESIPLLTPLKGKTKYKFVSDRRWYRALGVFLHNTGSSFGKIHKEFVALYDGSRHTDIDVSEVKEFQKQYIQKQIRKLFAIASRTIFSTPQEFEEFVRETVEDYIPNDGTQDQELVPELPTKAPKLYKDRQKDPKLGRKLNALEFLEDVYGDWLNGQGGLYRGHIRVWDKPLYEGLYKIRKSIPKFDELLPISEVQFDNLNKTPAEILEKQRDQAKQRKQRYLKK